ncbi:PHD finger protein rhinoceros [Punica granatum]|uniref:Uncharacterized protein n=2 Tax=Punica granatum TaxID=22663 RepID=A0A218W020_PUNGR|nr:PHD finger protein rhinoceros [Punica granatum]OWM66105.1 hypothetical protein CDL15_Pgr015532 [Punica granatum]PKI49080.1 hypothetical protein CRG98_030532 [Punica granatum]
MLHKSFKPAKCKTALKLAVSRAKLLKNKKEVVVKQLKRELAQLLESGQDQNARIRVEHVVREEKMMAAYELIEIFCELIAIRLPIIESQKNCPIDLKEAVSSVIFAAPRCSDIPELADVRKHFTAKYGKEFVSAAIELRPDGGVNRTMIEKLSAKAPDGQTKLKILTAIAKEHNIKWDPKSFGEKDSNPREDLLNGPTTFGNANNMNVESSNVQAHYYGRGTPDIHNPPQNEVKQEAPINYNGNNIRSSFGSQNVNPADVNASAAPSPHWKPSGNGMDRMESGNLHSEDQSPNFANRQDWNMEFEDATAAAQAAAESAERASMAARAAAKLSSRGKAMNQYSTGSQGSSAYARDGTRRHSRSSFDSEAFAGGQMGNNFERSSRTQNEEIGAKERHDFMGDSEGHYGDSKSNNRPSQLPAAASTSDSFKDNNPLSRPPVRGMSDESSQNYGGWNYQEQTTAKQDADEEEEEEEDVDLATLTKRLCGGGRQTETGSGLSSFKKTSGDAVSNKASFQQQRNSQNIPPNEDVTIDEFSMRRQSEKFEAEPYDETLYGQRTEKAKNLEDERFRKDFTGYSYSGSSPARSSSDQLRDVESKSQDLVDAVTENPFAHFDEEKFHEDAKPANASGSVVFDDYASDGENSAFDLDKGPETSSHIFSPDRKSTGYLSENISAPSLRRNRVDIFGNDGSESHSLRDQNSASVFSESEDAFAVRVDEDEIPPAVFDDASGFHSEREEEEPEKYERDVENVLGSRPKKSHFNLISKGSDKFDDPADKESQDWLHHSRVSSAHEADDDSWASQKSAAVNDSETLGKSSPDDATELSLGKLTGGLKNKGYRHPPYVRSSLGEISSSRQEAADEAKNTPPVSNQPRTSSSPEIADDLYDQEVRILKGISTRGRYGSSLGEASAMRKPLEDTAKKSSFSSTTRKESIDSDNDDSYTQDVDVDYKRLSGRLEEKSVRRSSVEAPSTKQAGADSSAKYGFSSPPRQISGSRWESNNHGMDSAAGRQSITLDYVSSYGSDQTEGRKDEFLSQASGSRARYGAGLSRRTKGSPSKTDRSTLFKPSPAPVEEETREPIKISSTSSYSDRRSEVKSAYPSEEAETRDRRADTKSSLRSSFLKPSYTPEEEETREPLRVSSRRSSTDKMREVKPAYPSVDVKTPERRLEIKPSSRSSYGSETYRSTRSERTASDSRGSSDRPQSGKEALERPKSEPKKASERPSASPQKSGSAVPSTSSKPAKPSLGDTSRENSFNKASHVHPKLPDYDTIAAQLELLRANRNK